MEFTAQHFQAFFLFRTDKDHQIKLNDNEVFQYLEKTCGTKNALVVTAFGQPTSGKTRALNQLLQQWHLKYHPQAAQMQAPAIPFWKSGQNEGVLVAVYNIPQAPVPLVCLDVWQNKGRNEKLYKRLLNFCVSVSNSVVFTYSMEADPAKAFPTWIPESIPSHIVCLGLIWTKDTGTPKFLGEFLPGKTLPFKEEVRAVAASIFNACGRPFIYAEQRSNDPGVQLPSKLIEAFEPSMSIQRQPQFAVATRMHYKVNNFGFNVGPMPNYHTGFLKNVSGQKPQVVSPKVPKPGNWTVKSSPGNYSKPAVNITFIAGGQTQNGAPRQEYTPKPAVQVPPIPRAPTGHYADIEKRLWITQVQLHTKDLKDVVDAELGQEQLKQLIRFNLIEVHEFEDMLTISGSTPEEKARIFVKFLASKEPPYPELLDKLAKVFDSSTSPKMSTIFKSMKTDMYP